jgi:hypothetical protein
MFGVRVQPKYDDQAKIDSGASDTVLFLVKSNSFIDQLMRTEFAKSQLVHFLATIEHLGLGNMHYNTML